MSNRQIGKLCDGLSYSAVAKAYQRFLHQSEKERSLREEIERIGGHLSQVKTPLPHGLARLKQKGSHSCSRNRIGLSDGPFGRVIQG